MDDAGAIVETGGAAVAGPAASAMARKAECTNCGAPLTGRFCAACGQLADSHRRSAGHLFRDFIKDVASFDSRILRASFALLFRPGELALAFREGRVQRYVPPVRLYLFVSLIFFLALEISHVAIIQFVMLKATPEGIFSAATERGGAGATPQHGSGQVNFSTNVAFLQREGSLHSKLDPKALQQLQAHVERILTNTKGNAKDDKGSLFTRALMATSVKLAADPAALNGALTAWIPRVMVLLLPVFALVLAAFYWRQRQTLFFVDHLVFSLSFHSFAFAALLGAAAAAQFVADDVALIALLVLLSAYLLVAMKRFYGQSWLLTGLKWVSAWPVYFCLCVLPAFGLVIAAAVFWG